MPFNKTFSAAINFNIIIMTNKKTLIMKKGDQKGLKDQTLSTNHNLHCSYENLCLNDPLNGVNSVPMRSTKMNDISKIRMKVDLSKV